MTSIFTAMNTSFVLVALVIGAVLLFWRISATDRETELLPPGPKPLPVVGNVRDLPPPDGKDWEHWVKHKDLYGPISSVNVFGTTIILLNDYQLAFQLLEKRGNTHSSRPQMVFFGDMVGWGRKHTGFLKYNDEFRLQRKQIHAIIGTPSTAARFTPLQDAEVHRFLLRVLRRPQDLRKHIKTLTSAILLKMIYGYTTEPKREDPLVKAADDTMIEFAWAAKPGAWLVDLIPALQHIPGWVPGTSFKKIAKRMKARMLAVRDVPIQFVKDQMKQGTNKASFASAWIERTGVKGSDEDESLGGTAMSLYVGGSDTTAATLEIFYLAMALNPSVQHTAQEEIDRIVGGDRLPTIEDRGSLPYIEAVMKETYRWHPVAGMGLPHESSADDHFEGYLIPKGSTILPNIWWFSRNPEDYPDPDAFRPKRFLGANPDRDPRNFIFGFGRRKCPGILLAESTVWLTIARTLAVFRIGGAVDATGGKIAPDRRFKGGVVSHPEAFNIDISPRSERHRRLIEQVEILHPWEEGNAKALGSLEI